MRTSFVVGLALFAGSVFSAPVAQPGGIDNILGSITNPSSLSDNLLKGNGDGNGNNNGNNNQAGNNNGNNNQAGNGNEAGNGNTINLREAGVVSDVLGSVKNTVGSITDPSALDANKLLGNGNNNGNGNGNGNSAGNGNGNGNVAGNGNQAGNGNSLNFGSL